MNGRMTGVVRGFALLVLASLLVACGSSHVVREYGSRSSKPPVRVSGPAPAPVSGSRTRDAIVGCRTTSCCDGYPAGNAPAGRHCRSGAK
jgi:hypothetical protein